LNQIASLGSIHNQTPTFLILNAERLLWYFRPITRNYWRRKNVTLAQAKHSKTRPRCLAIGVETVSGPGEIPTR